MSFRLCSQELHYIPYYGICYAFCDGVFLADMVMLYTGQGMLPKVVWFNFFVHMFTIHK